MVEKAPAAGKAAGGVPESVLKKRKRDEDWATKKAAAVTEAKKKSKDKRKDIFKRAEKYVKEYRDQVRVLTWTDHRRADNESLDNAMLMKIIVMFPVPREIA